MRSMAPSGTPLHHRSNTNLVLTKPSFHILHTCALAPQASQQSRDCCAAERFDCAWKSARLGGGVKGVLYGAETLLWAIQRLCDVAQGNTSLSYESNALPSQLFNGEAQPTSGPKPLRAQKTSSQTTHIMPETAAPSAAHSALTTPAQQRTGCEV